jgi:Skp family chaperone for outer membrane proteins
MKFFSRLFILRSLVALSLVSPVLAADAPAPAAAPQPAPAAAASDGSNPAIATIDMKKIFEAHPNAKEAGAKIGADRDAMKTELEALLAKRKLMFEEVKKFDRSITGGKLEGTAMEQAQWLRKAKALDIEALDGKIREFQATHEKTLQETWAKLQGAIVADIDKAVAGAHGLKSFALLLDTNGSTTSGMAFVIHANPDLDRSGPVQKQLAGEKTDSAAEPPSGTGVNLATLDVKKIFAGYYKTKDAEDAINAIRAKRDKEIADRTATVTGLEGEVKTIDAALNGTALTVPLKKAQSKQRAVKLDELKQLDKELRDLPATRDLEVQKLSTTLKAAIVEDINKAIADAVQANGHVDLLLDAGGPSLNGIPVVLHQEGVPNWSEAIVAKLNSMKPDAKKPSTEPKFETVSTSGLRFALIDMKRVFDVSPSVKAADQALNDARAAASRADATADVRNKVKDLETDAGKKRAEVLDKVTKLLAGREAKDSYQVVLDSSAKSLSGVALVKVQKAQPDLSDEMIAALTGVQP